MSAPLRGGVQTPIGPIWVEVRDGALTRLGFGACAAADTDPLLDSTLGQIGAWFAGGRRDFDLPLAPVTGFAAAMRAAMCAIPFGQTRTYGQIARDLGVSAQAVGQGCGANPLPLLVPCHRVLGATGLGGYSGAGGVETKVALLRHEGAAGLLI